MEKPLVVGGITGGEKRFGTVMITGKGDEGSEAGLALPSPRCVRLRRRDASACYGSAHWLDFHP